MLGQGKQHVNTAALPCQHGSHQKWENATASVERDPQPRGKEVCVVPTRVA